MSAKSYTRTGGMLLAACLYISSAIAQNTNGNWTIAGPVMFPINISEQIHGIGRVCQLKFHPSDPQKMYAASASGGLWISTNGGASWNKTGTDNNLPQTQCSSICVDYTNDNILYLSTGDPNYYSAGFGIYKSTDGGATWAASNSGIGTRMALEILMSPTDHNVLLAATNDGIWKSTNAGATWTVKKSGGAFKDMVYQSGSSTVVFAVEDAKFWRSGNGGDTWTQIASVNPGQGNGGRIAISAANPNVVYAGFVGSSGNNANPPTGGIIYRSTDGGLNFTLRKGDTQPNLNGYSATEDGQGNYNWCMFGDRSNASILYVGGHCNWKSTDGGATWTLLTNWYEKCHTDMHQLISSPFNNANLYNINDGGIFVSSDSGNNWAPVSDGLSATEAYHMGQSNLARNVSSIGTQDNGEMYVQNNVWYRNRGGDKASNFAYDFANPTTAYYIEGAQRRDIVANGDELSFGLTDDGTNDDRYAFTAQNTSLCYVSQLKVLRRTKNLLVTNPSWSAIKTFASNIKAVAVSPTNTNEVYVILDNQAVYYSSNAFTAANATFTQVSTAPVSTANIANIVVNKANTSIVYMTCGNKVYRSSNKAVSWTDITGSIPSSDIVKLVHDPYSTDESFYLATALGVYYRNSTLSGWQSFSNGLPTIAQITDLGGYFDGTTNSIIRVSFYGRGLWESPLYSAPGNGIVSGHTYKLISKVNNSSVLELQGGLTANSTPVQLYSDNGTDAQKWKVTDVGSGYYRLTPVKNTASALDVQGGSATDGAQAQIYTSNGTAAQRWQIISVGGGYFKLSPQCAPGSSLDVDNGGTADGTRVQIWSSDPNADAQKWKFADLGTPLAKWNEYALTDILTDDQSAEVRVGPNPARSEVSLFIQAKRNLLALMQIADGNGKLISFRRQELTTGQNKINFNVGTLAAGVYYVIVRMDERIITKKLIVQK